MNRIKLVDEMFGIDTEVAFLDDGIMLYQKQGSKEDAVFLTFLQVKQLRKETK